jgi:hypothetical protein
VGKSGGVADVQVEALLCQRIRRQHGIFDDGVRERPKVSGRVQNAACGIGIVGDESQVRAPVPINWRQFIGKDFGDHLLGFGDAADGQAADGHVGQGVERAKGDQQVVGGGLANPRVDHAQIGRDQVGVGRGDEVA